MTQEVGEKQTCMRRCAVAWTGFPRRSRSVRAVTSSEETERRSLLPMQRGPSGSQLLPNIVRLQLSPSFPFQLLRGVFRIGWHYHHGACVGSNMVCLRRSTWLCEEWGGIFVWLNLSAGTYSGLAGVTFAFWGLGEDCLTHPAQDTALCPSEGPSLEGRT